MAEKTLWEFSALTVENIHNSPVLRTENIVFELKPGLINMVEAIQYSGKANEDASTHLQDFMQIGNTIAIERVNHDIILLRLFPFSLVGRAKQWFYANKEDINSWAKCSKAFLAKFFPIGKTNMLRGKITNFQQQKTETISEAWEHLQGYIQNCPHHGMEEWLHMQGFYHGLNQKAHEHLDATTEGSFLSLTLGKAKELMEKISENQSWSQDKGEEAIEEVNALSTKMDELLHWLDQRAKYKEELHRTFYLLN